MRKHYAFLLPIAALLAASCADSDKYALDLDNEVTVQKPQYTIEFPKDDGSTNLMSLYDAPGNMYGGGPKTVRDILNKVGPSIANKLYNINITDEEYNEIKDYTNTLVDGCTTDASKYVKIFEYVNGNTTYYVPSEADTIQVSQDPYFVFKNKIAVCQGYANLLHVMLHSQSIPCVNVNGMMQGFGHAWNYVYVNDKWYVSDPTNNKRFTMDDVNSYYGYAPTMIDAQIYEDENFIYGYKYNHVTITTVKNPGEQLVVPFSVAGFTLTSFNPDSINSENIRELYLGKNINTFGDYGAEWSRQAPNIESVYVDPENTMMESYSNVIYRDKSVYYVAPKATVIEMKPAEYYGKETLKGLESLEIVIFPEGTKTIGAWAIEKCPNVKQVYVPEGVEIEDNAFAEVHPDFEIITGEYTNIPQIKM